MTKKKLYAFIWDSVMVLSIIIAVLWYFIPGNIDALGSTGTGSFRYFTTDSNILIAASTLIHMVYKAVNLNKNDSIAPRWLGALRYAAVTAGALTFLEVLLFMFPTAVFLGGIRGALRCYENNVFVLHFSAPLMMFISFVFFDKDYRPDKKERLIAMIPVIIYSVVYFAMVVVFRYWPDFYRFTFGGRYAFIPLVFVVIYSATFGISALIQYLKHTGA